MAYWTLMRVLLFYDGRTYWGYRPMKQLGKAPRLPLQSVIVGFAGVTVASFSSFYLHRLSSAQHAAS